MLRPFYHLLRASSCVARSHSNTRKKRSSDLARPLDVPPSKYSVVKLAASLAAAPALRAAK